jgi:hypothetical protein
MVCFVLSVEGGGERKRRPESRQVKEGEKREQWGEKKVNYSL